MAAVNHLKINRFCAIFLPPADLIVTNDPVRNYISSQTGEAQGLLNALGAAPVNENNITNAKRAFEMKSQEVEFASHAAADQWVDNAFSALLRAHLATIPTMENQYADDILYIVMSPEFGLNGWKDSPGPDGIKKWDASGAFPQSLETYIRERVRIKLESAPFIHFHILFVFSCFTHTTNTMVPQMALNNPRKVAANNRLNIVCRESPIPDPFKHTFCTVTKFFNHPADRVPPVFTPEKGWDSATQIMTFGTPNQSRDVEIKFTLPWTDVDNDSVTLGFGTCQDVLVDKHPSERMVIVCGSGTPFMRKPEVAGLPMSYPFLLNDSQSWSVTPPAPIKRPRSAPVAGVLRKDELQAAGYYQFCREPPVVGARSVASTFNDIWEADGSGNPVAHSENDRPEMARCYLYPPTIESDHNSFTDHRRDQTAILVSTTESAVPLFKYTDILAIPNMRFG